MGAVKPLDIPDVSPVEAIAGLLSPVLQKIRVTRAGNEQSEFLGSVSVAQERAAAAIADNPGMPFEDMNKIQKQMMKEIGKAGESLTLPESKNYARNFTLKNRKLIEEKFNTQKEAILTRHEMARFNLERERLITERKPDELKKHYASASGALLDPEVARLAYENDELEIEDLQAKADAEQNVNVVLASARAVFDQTQDLAKALNVIRDSKLIPEKDKQELQSDLVTEAGYRKAIIDDQLEIQREADRDVISKATQSADPNVLTMIDNSSLDEAEQHTWSERAKAESVRLAEGKDIITDNEVQTNLYDSLFEVFTGAKTHTEALEEAKVARLPGMDKEGKPVPPTLSQLDYETFEKALNANYKESYKHQMGKVNEVARGILLQPNSFGIIENAPIRYKIYSDFQKAWLKWIEDESEKGRIKISDIGPEGARMAASFHLTDEELGRQEQILLDSLRVKEEEAKAAAMASGKAAVEAIKKVAAQADLAKVLKPKEPKPITEKPKAVSDVPEPKDRREFINKLRELQKDNPDLSIEYYNKYLDKFW